MSLVNQIDNLLNQIPLINEYPVKGINCLLPGDTSKDIKNVLPALLNDLKDILNVDMGRYDSNRLCQLLELKFKV